MPAAVSGTGSPWMDGQVAMVDWRYPRRRHDRAAAEHLSGNHLTAGRLTSHEYAERATQAMSARTRAEIMALFRDLPAPHPRFEATVPPAIPQQRPQPDELAVPPTAAVLQRALVKPRITASGARRVTALLPEPETRVSLLWPPEP